MMIKQYRVIGPSYRIASGTVRLKKEQAEKRAYGLEKKGRSRCLYTVTRLVEFKRSEEFGLDTETARPALGVMLEEVKKERKADEPAESH